MLAAAGGGRVFAVAGPKSEAGALGLWNMIVTPERIGAGPGGVLFRTMPAGHVMPARPVRLAARVWRVRDLLTRSPRKRSTTTRGNKMNRNRNLLTTTGIAAMLAMPLAVQAGDDKAADRNGATTIERADTMDSGTGGGSEAATGTRAELERAWDGFAKFTAEQRDAAVQAGDDLLKAVDERIDGWREAAREDGVSSDEEQDRVAEMRAVRADIADRLDAAKVEQSDGWTAGAWSDFKESMGTAVDEFQALFEDTAYQDGNAPDEDATFSGRD